MPFIVKPPTNTEPTASRSETETPLEPPRFIGAITARQLKRKLAQGSKTFIVDVREPHERALRNFPGAKPIPLGQLYRRVKEFDPTTETVFICESGVRSLKAIEVLRDLGYGGVMLSLHEGVQGWVRDTQPFQESQAA
ncbi:MAG: rhodanese-like domain-containing protein [Propionibacteriaceae bacterium]|jgi:adenylyltransferase/sulfurtransferase|nr:rhodanese-like domain-containing protein [Propionibacteriaceae bacterium]